MQGWLSAFFFFFIYSTIDTINIHYIPPDLQINIRSVIRFDPLEGRQILIGTRPINGLWSGYLSQANMLDHYCTKTEFSLNVLVAERLNLVWMF